MNITAYLTRNIFQYDTLDLLLSYFLSALAAAIAILVALHALFLNRVSHSMSFSSIMRTTRNSDLDHLVREEPSKCHCLGAAPLNKSLKKTHLKFESADGHTAFQITDSKQAVQVDEGKEKSEVSHP